MPEPLLLLPWKAPPVPFLPRLEPRAPARAVAPALVSDHAAVLDELLSSSSSNLAVWRRSLPDGLSQTLETWVRSGAQPTDRRFSLATSSLEPWLEGLPPGEARRWLEQDILQLLRNFCAALGETELRLVLGPVLNDRCRKFHVDYLRMRMLCTYVGPGTEWVDEPWVRRDVLRTDEDGSATNQQIVPDLDKVQRAGTGDVLWIRGREDRLGWRGGVHRSPPVAGTGQVRLVLAASTMG